MPKIQNVTDLGSIKEPKEFIRHGSRVISNTVDTVNGNLEFDKNLSTKTVVVTFAAANADTAVNTGMTKPISGYLVARKSVDCSIFDGVTPDNGATIYLRSSQPATVTIIFY